MIRAIAPPRGPLAHIAPVNMRHEATLPYIRSSILIAASLFFVACSESTGPAAPNIETTEFASALGVDLDASTKTSSGLYYRDITPGAGDVVGSGDRVAIHYTGSLANGTQFDQNIEGQTPFPFTVGAGAVIDGMDEGVRGMRIGGTRQLIIPPRLGYGTQRFGPIPGNSILVFTVEIVSIE